MSSAQAPTPTIAQDITFGPPTTDAAKRKKMLENAEVALLAEIVFRVKEYMKEKPVAEMTRADLRRQLGQLLAEIGNFERNSPNKQIGGIDSLSKSDIVKIVLGAILELYLRGQQGKAITAGDLDGLLATRQTGVRRARVREEDIMEADEGDEEGEEEEDDEEDEEEDDEEDEEDADDEEDDEEEEEEEEEEDE